MDLRNDRQQNIQGKLDFSSSPAGEACEAGREEDESLPVVHGPESPASTNRLMEEVCERENLKKALRRVKANKGSAGVDGMTVGEITGYLKQHWPAIREQLLSGTYKPQPVRRVEIPKPDGGGVRKLGIPSTLDRFIQQAVMQVLQRRWDRTFSDHSYGFRQGRSAQQAVAQAQQYIAEGHGWCVDLDLEKFFDRVNHDKLMGQIAKRVEDKRLLKLIRAFLNAGVMEGGLVSPSVEGTPQGGPLSPLLSNLVLDDLDRELERRGHRFVRYADDSNIYVRSERAGQQVMEELAPYLRGWRGYFGFCETPSVLQRLDSWVRRRVRCAFWRQWKTGRKRFAELVRRGVSEDLAAKTAGSRRGPWHVSQSPALDIALSNAALTSLGLPSLVEGR